MARGCRAPPSIRSPRSPCRACAADLTLILEIDPAEGLARAAARGDANRYEALDAAFHARVRAGFRAIAAAEPQRCALIDATDAPEGVAGAILQAVRARLPA